MAAELNWKQKMQKYIKQQKGKRGVHIWVATGIALAILIIAPVLHEDLEAFAPLETDVDEALFTAHMVGDIMMGRHVEEVTEHYGYDELFRYVEPLFQHSDYVTGNFEHPVLLGDEEDYPQADKYIHIHAPPESVEVLKRMNFSNVNLANNHTMDYGEPGLQDTLATFAEAGLPQVGTIPSGQDEQDILYQEINGLTVATLGFTDAYISSFAATGLSGGVEVIPHDFTDQERVVNMLTQIRRAKEEADLVMVHVHWGQEYDNSPQPRQRYTGRAFANAGADIIIGHHPHVLMEAEIYDPEQYEQVNDAVIMYSLGNFIFDQGWSRTRESAIAEYRLFADGSAELEFIPVYVRESSPQPLAGLMSSYRQSRIFTSLTKGTDADTYVKEEGRLIFELDHSHVLSEGVELDGE